MSLCINPDCPQPRNTGQLMFCMSCGSELLLQGIYRVTKKLGKGGFATTYEVSECGVPKVLKVLHHKDPKALELFKREVEVLMQLNHPGIPKVESGAYFTFKPRNSHESLHCFVMEQVEGLNLAEWMHQRGNQPIPEKTGLYWLKQLTEILQVVHGQNYFHRDIKPSNIILRPDGQLALIDFGAIRELSYTYMQKSKLTVISSAGYTPPEQANGRAVPQSDFFALGRTLVYLFTGKEIHELNEHPQTGELMWRDYAPQISERTVHFINYLMAPFCGNRPQNTQNILDEIAQILQSINQAGKRHNKKTFFYGNAFPRSAIKHAGFWRRLAAFIIDMAVCFIFIFLLFVLVPSDDSIDLSEYSYEMILWNSIVFGLITDFIIGLYYAFMESSQMQATIGKQILKIIVTDNFGYKISFRRALWRYFCVTLIAFLTILIFGVVESLMIGLCLTILIAGIDCMSIVFTDKKRAVHDIIAGTLVILK